MRLRLLAFLLCLVPLAAQAQYQGCRQNFPSVDFSTACIQLSGSNVVDINGNKLTSGRFVLTVTNSSGTPVSYTPAGGSSSSATFVGQIVNGAVQNISGFPFTIVNTLTASPSGLVFHYQLQSTDGATTYQDYPLWSLTSTTGGTSLDTFNALPGTIISGMGGPRASCSGTAEYRQTDAVSGAKPWICSNLFRTDKSNQWTQNPSSNPQCQMGQAVVSPRVGSQYCILPENAYALPGEGFVNPSTSTPGPMMVEPLGSGSANLPHTNDMLAGDNLGNGVAVPEKGTTLVTGTPNTAAMAWDEDYNAGRFDCRNPKYAGGCLGGTPGAAMQAFSDALVCYQSITGKHARTQFPPGTITVGTVAQPTLKLPAGVIYEGGGGWGFGTNATEFQASYNNHAAFEIDPGLTSTTNCSDGVPHTSTVGGGSLDGISQHGCGQGGCGNVPGDSGNYPFGGPLQTGISVTDADMTVGKKSGVFARNNGGDGVLCNPQDGHCYEVGGSDNNEYFYFGIDVAGQNYQFNTGECHGDVVLGGLDGMYEGPFETYGTFMTPGIEYGHVAGICWAGGITNIGPFFSQIEEIGIIHMAGGNVQASAATGRIDAARGIGILEQSAGKTTWINPRVVGACRFDGANDYVVFNVTTATPGSGQTNGTYLLTANSGAAQISVTVAGGAIVGNPVVTVHGRAYTATPPTFTMTAGGTPGTFTVAMENIFQLLHNGGGLGDFTSCDYVEDNSGGNNTYVSPSLLDNSFFGASHATGDIVSVISNTWIQPHGNNGGDGVIWEPSIVAAGYPTAREQKIIMADKSEAGGGLPATGSTLNLAFGYHIQMQNSSPTTLTNITGNTIMSDLWITGDGFTTMPQATFTGAFGSNNCFQHDTVLKRGQLYHYLLTGGNIFSQPSVYTEQCDSIFNDYWQPGFQYLAANGALPSVTTMATSDVAGAMAVRPYPALPALTISTAGTASAFTYCYVTEVWTAGGKQTTPALCNAKTPPVTTTSFDNVQLHLALPQNWTRYKVFLNSTTDPGFTPGVWYDVSTTTGGPKAAQCDFTVSFGCVAGSFGLFINNVVPTDTSTVATANIGLNLTGTYNVSLGGVALPASSSTLCVKGQVLRDVSGGFDYVCDAEDHWKRAAITWANF